MRGLVFISESDTLHKSRSDLMTLAAMEYCLSVGLGFETVATALKQLYGKEPEFTNPASERRFMLWWDSKKRSLELVDFDMEKAIASLNAGEPVIPVWLDKIHQRVVNRLVA